MPVRVLTQGLSALVTLTTDRPVEEQIQEGVALGVPRVYIATPANKYYLRQTFQSLSPDSPSYVQLSVNSIPGYTPQDMVIAQDVKFLPAGKIPMELLRGVLSFFRAVCTKHDAKLEAMIWICWNAEQGYHLIVPNQRVGAASASYDWGSLPTGDTIIVDIHSHGGMGAFFSGTDDGDDRGSVRYSGVIGKVMDPTPEYKLRFNFMDRKIDATLADVFEHEESFQVPEEWLGKVTTHQAGVAMANAGHTGYQGHIPGQGVQAGSVVHYGGGNASQQGATSSAQDWWTKATAGQYAAQQGQAGAQGAGGSTQNPPSPATPAGTGSKNQTTTSTEEVGQSAGFPRKGLDGRPIAVSDPDPVGGRSVGFGTIRPRQSEVGGVARPKARALPRG